MKHSIPAMIAGEGGSIVNISSPANLSDGHAALLLADSKATLNQPIK
jgi:NAD(P)-dependent dehydrogenase (short-subunit alcohol dehydrogenase family)